MLEIIKIYKEHKQEIENFIITNLRNNNIVCNDNKTLDTFFKTFKSLQLLYVVDKDYKQVSPSFSKKSTNFDRIGRNRKAFFQNKKLDLNGEYISAPYTCSVTGNTIITAIKKVNEEYYIVMDYNLIELLEDLGYVTNAVIFNKINKIAYSIIGYGLIFLSLLLTIYVFISFFLYIVNELSFIHTTFKAIISLTLSLAIFDLGKNLLEHEVVYKNHQNEKEEESKLFTKFLISIITALSIESLLLVLKSGLTKDYSNIDYAVYLIIAISFMIISLGVFFKFTQQEEKKKEE